MAERRKSDSTAEQISEEHLPIYNQFRERLKRIRSVKGVVGQSLSDGLVIMIAVDSDSENTWNRIADIEYSVAHWHRAVKMTIEEWDMRYISDDVFRSTIGKNHDVASRLVTTVQARA